MTRSTEGREKGKGGWGASKLHRWKKLNWSSANMYEGEMLLTMSKVPRALTKVPSWTQKATYLAVTHIYRHKFSNAKAALFYLPIVYINLSSKTILQGVWHSFWLRPYIALLPYSVGFVQPQLYYSNYHFHLQLKISPFSSYLTCRRSICQCLDQKWSSDYSGGCCY